MIFALNSELYPQCNPEMIDELKLQHMFETSVFTSLQGLDFWKICEHKIYMFIVNVSFRPQSGRPPKSCPLEAQECRDLTQCTWRLAARMLVALFIRSSSMSVCCADFTVTLHRWRGEQKSETKPQDGGKDLQHSVAEPWEVWWIKQTPWSTLLLVLSHHPCAFWLGSVTEQETAEASGESCGATA